MSPPQQAEHSSVAALAERAGAQAWSPDALPWGDEVDWSSVGVPEKASILAGTPALRSMTASESAHARQREMASHLAALTIGESKAVGLAAETVLLCPEGAAEQRWFLGTLLADEAKHELGLRRFVEGKLGWRVRPHLELDAVFAELSRERDYELNLLAGQVVLEGAAATLLNGMLLGVEQPLLRELLRNVARDEARHIRFAHLVSTPIADVAPVRRRRMEEVLFEAAHAAVASLVPADTWDELGLDPAAARAASVDSLRARGVLAFFTKIVARELGLRGFPADDLGATLERNLEARLRSHS
jgi:hypothetical protein